MNIDRLLAIDQSLQDAYSGSLCSSSTMVCQDTSTECVPQHQHVPQPVSEFLQVRSPPAKRTATEGNRCSFPRFSEDLSQEERRTYNNDVVAAAVRDSIVQLPVRNTAVANTNPFFVNTTSTNPFVNSSTANLFVANTPGRNTISNSVADTADSVNHYDFPPSTSNTDASAKRNTIDLPVRTTQVGSWDSVGNKPMAKVLPVIRADTSSKPYPQQSRHRQSHHHHQPLQQQSEQQQHCHRNNQHNNHHHSSRRGSGGARTASSAVNNNMGVMTSPPVPPQVASLMVPRCAPPPHHQDADVQMQRWIDNSSSNYYYDFPSPSSPSSSSFSEPNTNSTSSGQSIDFSATKSLSLSLNSLLPQGDMIEAYTKAYGVNASKDPTIQRAFYLLDQSKCFYGNLKADAARKFLKHSAVGTFLLRNSSDQRFLFSLSVKTKRGVTAVRIAYNNGEFSLDCEEGMSQRMPTFCCILDLLQFYSDTTAANSRQNNNNNMCVFLETGSGRRDTVIRLRRARPLTVLSLKAIARRKLNGLLNVDQKHRLLLFMSPDIEQFMQDYPYFI